MRIVNPVVKEPLLAEWDAVKAEIQKDKTKGRAKAPLCQDRCRLLQGGFVSL